MDDTCEMRHDFTDPRIKLLPRRRRRRRRRIVANEVLVLASPPSTLLNSESVNNRRQNSRPHGQPHVLWGVWTPPLPPSGSR